MAGTISQTAYDSAAVVFSQSFRFVEWKYVIASKGVSAPLGDHGEPQLKATKKIDRKKWIYVFRHDEREEYAAIKEEIRVDANGAMYATPAEHIEKPIKLRGKQVALGPTMSVPRRILGKPKVHRFYASRVRLEVAQIKQLERVVHTFVPRTIFDPNDNTSVVVQDGKLLVPVVDPITVALHLHAAFVGAADDVIDYTAAHAGLRPAERKAVELRRKKHLLGSLLKAIIGDEKNVAANNLVAELKGQQGPLEDFLAHYDKQLEWRVRRRDRLAHFLSRWLESDGMKVAEAAHKTLGKDEWVRFLVPWCHATTRLVESRHQGHPFLKKVLDDKGHFVHTFVMPQRKMSEDAVQAVRKGGMTIFETWAGLAEMKIVSKGVAEMTEVANSYRHLRGLSEKTDAIKVASKQLESVNRKITSPQLIDATADNLTQNRPFATGAKTLGAIVESVNLVLAIKAVDEALKGENEQVKRTAILNLVGSSLDATSAIASLLRKGEKVTYVLGFVSGVIDIVLGVREMDAAFKDGDQDVANGAFLTAAGATIGTVGSLLAFGAVPGFQVVMVLGLAVVAIGMIYKWLKGKEPLEKFFLHSSWGKNHDLIVAGKLKGGADWSPTKFEQWRGDKEFDYQLEALLNIITKPEVSHGDTFRDLRFKSGWLPPNSRLLILYQEQWQSPSQPFIVEGEIVIDDKGPSTTDARLVVTPDGKTGVKVKVVSGVPATSPNLPIKYPTMLVPHKSLKSAFASARLMITLEGAAAVKVPHDKPEKKTFHG